MLFSAHTSVLASIQTVMKTMLQLCAASMRALASWPGWHVPYPLPCWSEPLIQHDSFTRSTFAVMDRLSRRLGMHSKLG